MRLSVLTLFFALLLGVADQAVAQRAASPRGEASTQIGSTDGPWIVVDYGRPILRGRSGVFGTADDYGQAIYAGAPVWRAGANVSTKLTTETDLMFGSSHLPAGEYTMFVELNSPTEWTLIISNHKGKSAFRSEEEGIWGAYNYTPEKDVLRVPMSVEPMDISIDQFTISFLNVTTSNGMLAMAWDRTMATASFMIH